MRIAGVYSFNGGKQEVSRLYPDLMTEVNEVINLVDSSTCKTKESTEKTMMGQMRMALNGRNPHSFPGL